MDAYITQRFIGLGSSKSTLPLTSLEDADAIHQQNELLTNKIMLIEKQNMEQQIRLQHLEKLVMELSTKRTGIELSRQEQRNYDNFGSCGHSTRTIPERHDWNYVNACAVRDSGTYDSVDDKYMAESATVSKYIVREPEHHKQTDSYLSGHGITHASNCRRVFENLPVLSCPNASQNSNTSQAESNCVLSRNSVLEMSDDVMSIMEEFDRTAREHGLKYSMTPTRSVISSEDIVENAEFEREFTASLKEDHANDNDLASPTKAFLTPSYQCTALALSQYESENGPMITPQACLTTPVLLTAEALRTAEKLQDSHQLERSRTENNLKPLHDSYGYRREYFKKWESNDQNTKLKKVNPFANLISGLRQVSKPAVGNNCKNNSKYYRSSGLLQIPVSPKKVPVPNLSPANSCISSLSSHIRNWSQSLKLPHLSPMPESHCSDIEMNASDDELLTDKMFSVSEEGGECE
ncbi:hypothetical protein SK128_025381, partial [Halocaridina rubra]